MEENRLDYDNTEFEDDYTPQPDSGKSIRGYRIVIIILSVILVAISALYFSIHRQQMLDNELLRADRDSIQNDLGRLMEDYDTSTSPTTPSRPASTSSAAVPTR